MSLGPLLSVESEFRRDISDLIEKWEQKKYADDKYLNILRHALVESTRNYVKAEVRGSDLQFILNRNNDKGDRTLQ